MTTSIQQTNNNQTVGFPHTPTAHQKANGINEKRNRPNDYVLARSNIALGLEVLVSPSGLVVMGFKGKQVKASFHYRFKTTEAAKNYIDSFVSSVEKRAADKAAAKLERKATVRALEVGDVLVSSWGYDQTNIDYYQVIDLVGKSSVLMQQICKTKSFDAQDSGSCVPVVNSFVGEPFVKRVSNGVSVSLTSYSSARKKDFSIVDGVKVFKPDFWSSYA